MYGPYRAGMRFLGHHTPLGAPRSDTHLIRPRTGTTRGSKQGLDLVKRRCARPAGPRQRGKKSTLSHVNAWVGPALTRPRRVPNVIRLYRGADRPHPTRPSSGLLKRVTSMGKATVAVAHPPHRDASSEIAHTLIVRATRTRARAKGAAHPRRPRTRRVGAIGRTSARSPTALPRLR
jgi:hypothetical protein